MTTSKETENVFLNEVSIVDIFLSILSENIEYTHYINEFIDDIASREEGPKDD